MDTSKRNPLQDQTLGDAHFATPEEVGAAGLAGSNGIRLGYYKAPGDRGSDWGQVIRYGGDAHLITVAPTRSGKGRDVLIPALLEYPGSCIVIDPKGQLAAVTKAHRERPKAEGGLEQEVIVLNPFNLLSGELGPTAQYNPMAALDPEADSFGADCDSLAEAIVIRDGRGESHWPDSARQLVSGMIMHLVAKEPPELQNLAAVQRLVSGPTKNLRDFVKDALDADDEDSFITARLARFENINDESREALGIISTAITQTGFIGNAAIARSLSGSDFRFRDLKDKAITVYLVLPAKQIETCGKWFRLVVASALADLWSETRGAVPVLAILDEFAQLGRLQAIENAMGLAAGFGLQLWPILQNLTQLKKDYGDNWETFLGGAAIQQFFGPRDEFTADYISKLCGVKTVVTHGQSIQHAEEILQKDRTGASWGQQSQPLLHPHNVRSMGPNECLILGPQNIVIDAFRKPYRQMVEFKGVYSPDPYHKSDRPTQNSTSGPDDPPPPSDSFAAREAAAAAGIKKALAKKRALSIRLLTWGSSPDPRMNALRKLEYVLTLPLRIPAALVAAPFVIHNRPLQAVIGFIALFGFWEVWEGFAKQPFLNVYQIEEKLCRDEQFIRHNALTGHTMACRAEALRVTGGFFWQHAVLAVLREGPTNAFRDFDLAFNHEQAVELSEVVRITDHGLGERVPPLEKGHATFDEKTSSGTKPKGRRQQANSVADANIEKPSILGRIMAWFRGDRSSVPLASAIGAGIADRVTVKRGGLTVYTTPDIYSCTSLGLGPGRMSPPFGIRSRCSGEGLEPLYLKGGIDFVLFRGQDDKTRVGVALDGTPYYLAQEGLDNGQYSRFWVSADDVTCPGFLYQS